MTRRLVLFLWVGIFGALASQARANPVRTEKTEAELIASVAAVKPGQSFDVGLRLKPDAGWHTYWKNPGDSGAATTIRWKLPDGFSAGEIQWPPPVRIRIEPLLDFGYRGEVFLITRITAPESLKPGQNLRITASARWLVCETVCIPGKAELELGLPTIAAGAAPPRVDLSTARQFERVRSELPQPLEGWRSSAAQSGTEVTLRLEPPADESLAAYREVDFFPDQPGIFDHAKQAPVELKHDALVFRLPRARASDRRLEAVSGILVVRRATNRGTERRAYPVSAPLRGDALRMGGEVTPWSALLLAALGGLLLNLMPCVFPVMSMKVLGFVSKAGQTNSRVRAHAAWFMAGVLVSFWALAGALLAARAAGQGLGWGFQLQSPVFVTGLALLFFLLGLNLLGLFEISGRWMGVGGGLAAREGALGSFFSGVLATVVATPCTAPFMGAALGFALSQSPLIAFAVFTALGLGMAAPYLVLAFSPALLKRLPKPGRWMETLKQFLAFPLFATVIWLLWTLALQTHVDVVARVLGGIWAIALGLWIVRRGEGSRAAKAIGAACAAAGVAFAIIAASAGQAKDDGIAWQPWSEARVRELVADNRPVFVDFTAAWCITCQVNKRVALQTPEVRERFEALGIVPLRADWTSYDPEITRALEALGRSGVPVYALYSGRAGEAPVLLPEVLTAGIVLGELDRMFPLKR